MRVAVIGAGGFVGRKVVGLLVDRTDISEVCAVDRAGLQEGAKVRCFQGDFADAGLRDRAVAGADAVIHLAAILGGAAEADPLLARRINLDATLDLMDHLRGEAPNTRFVFASTVAVLKTPMVSPATDAAPLGGTMLYGAHKHMIETALSTYSARGWLDGVSLRPSGVMARDGADAALKSAFISRVFYAVARGQDITLPVAEDSRTWLASVTNVAQNFVHAALMPDVGETRAMTLPAVSLTFGELVAALRRAFPHSPSRVTFDPEPDTIALFGSMPTLVTETADKLGFSCDKNADALVRDAMEDNT